MFSRSILSTQARRALISMSSSASSSAGARATTATTRNMIQPAMTISPLNITKRFYHPKVIDHYQNPRNVGSFGKDVPNIGTGLVGAPACGDVMRLQIKVNDETGIIEDVKFKTFGCGSAIASSSYLTEIVKGLSLEEAAKIKNTTIAKELSLPPVKLHCSMLAEDAIKSAIKDYKSKRVVKKPTLGPESVVSDQQQQQATASATN